MNQRQKGMLLLVLIATLSLQAAPVMEAIGTGIIVVFTGGHPNAFKAVTVRVSNMEEGKVYTMLTFDSCSDGAYIEHHLFQFVGTTGTLTTNCIIMPGWDVAFYRTSE